MEKEYVEDKEKIGRALGFSPASDTGRSLVTHLFFFSFQMKKSTSGSH